QPSSPMVVGGFYEWEGASRWMSKRGVLRLKPASSRFSILAAAPVNALRRTHPDWSGMEVRVALMNEGQERLNIGAIRLTVDEPVTEGLEIPLEISDRLKSQWIQVVLECDQVWTPKDALPGSADDRKITVQVFRAGFAPPASW